ncbi:MAG: transposase domain-containing protein, partial [Pseudomonadota bacterium]
RKGEEALKRMYPPQVRDKTNLHALECVNADGHRWDVFVRWPDGTVGRPVMVAFQDVYSGRILSWRVDQSENRIAVLLALGDMVEAFGIPDHCVLDNGRNFASKWLTGGTPTRYRFKVKADEPVGVLPLLGVKVHWTLPYSGQSKPIERAFGEFSDAIAKDPRLAGAYTGNRPDAKPENYGKAAIPIDDFLEVVAEGIAEHNTRTGRTGQVAKLTGGRSFVEAFDESFVRAPIRSARPEQRRLWLMGVERLSAHRESGRLMFQDNVYWSPEISPRIAGTAVAARFDPENLHDGLHVYALDGRYLGHMPAFEKTGFLSLEGAQSHARARTQFMKAEREKAVAARAMDTIALQNALRDAGAPTEGKPTAPKVVTADFGRGRSRDAVAPAAATATAAASAGPGFDQDAIWDAQIAAVQSLTPKDDP